MENNNEKTCWNCQHKRSVPGDCHISCAKFDAKVEGSPHGIKNGWFYWPFNFDPIWLKSCDSFEEKVPQAGKTK